jgi:redox-sensitive bicupin YhaK (pirin superfamily)
MTAGRGIVHSERSADDVRAAGGPLFGLQTWVALPRAHEETDPAFFHHAAADIPEAQADGVTIRVVAGTCDGMTSPVRTFSDMFYADIALADGARYRLTTEHIERAVYVITGAVEVEGQQGGFDAGELVILKPDSEIVLRASGPARIMLVGGEPLAEPRHIYWNFVSSSKDRIEQAKDDWIAQRFDAVPGETEFIPLPA